MSITLLPLHPFVGPESVLKYKEIWICGQSKFILMLNFTANFHFYRHNKILKYSLNLNTCLVASRNFKWTFELTTRFDYMYNKFHAIIRPDTSLYWRKPIWKKARKRNNKKNKKSLHFIDNYTQYIPNRYSEK